MCREMDSYRERISNQVSDNYLAQLTTFTQQSPRYYLAATSAHISRRDVYLALSYV